jgi:large subunit ribosomal protein L2
MKKLKTLLPKNSGRNMSGKLTVRHQGGRHKRFLRAIDFKRDKKDMWGKVVAIEYDPNRNAPIALLSYSDGEKRYIISPVGLKEGDKVMSGENAPLDPGNALPLKSLPIGTVIHNIEIRPGKGAQMVKGAGGVATVQGKEDKNVLVKLPSGEVKRFSGLCLATIGQVGNPEAKNRRYYKAGQKRWQGIKPTVRGVAMHPGAHPHGGGEGRSSVGLKYQKTVYGKKAVGNTRRRKKYSDKSVVKKRK